MAGSSAPRPVRGKITEDTTEAIRDRLTLSSVIGRKVALKKKGREHSGLCPFHTEKTPSFWVNDHKAFFHCFGCGAHGDVIGFTMRAEGLTFPEAVEKLAHEAGVAAPVYTARDSERAAKAATLYQVQNAAAGWFQRQLATPAGKAGLDYLRGRGLDDKMIEVFGLGVSPDHSREALRVGLKREGVTEAQLIEAGLVAMPDDAARGPYERFRGRVMFPIHDRRGRVIAFGGRVLDDGTPKYLNSPESPIFAKGETLYAQHLAREAAAAGRPVIVVEGYLDVIALHQAGFDGAVAPLGTALTEAQLGALWRLADEPYLCFDGDAAGQRAAERAAERALPLLQPGKSLRFVTLPEGEDPDSLARKGGAAAIEAALAAAVPLVDVVWRIGFDGGADTPERRAGIRKVLLERVATIADPGVREHYRVDIEKRLNKAWGRFRPTVIPGGRQGSPDGPDGTDRAPSSADARGRGEAREGDGRADRMAGELLDEIELWHDERGQAFATFDINDHRENWPIKSEQFPHWLRWRAQLRGESLLGAADLEKVSGALAARAMYEGRCYDTFTRVAERDGWIYVDLGGPDWRCVEIRPVPLDSDAPKWRVLDRAPVKFIRRPSMRPMAAPVPGGSIDELRGVLNVATEADFRLVIGWLLACYRAAGPFPLLVVNGPQGSGKSIMLRVLARLVDPTQAPERNLPRDERDLFVAATSGHLQTFDNLSGISGSMADALCRIATGGGYSTRALHTNDAEHIMSACKPVLLNGIPDLARRGDLADRALLVTAARLTAENRRTEEAFWADFDEREPGILGALFDTISYALTTYAETPIPPVRMADAARFMEAGAAFLGWEEGTFARILRANRLAAIEAVVDSDLFAIELLRLLAGAPDWRGTTAELLDGLNNQAADKVKRSAHWPANPSAARGALDRIKDALEAKGYGFERGKSGDRRWVQFARLAPDDGEVAP